MSTVKLAIEVDIDDLRLVVAGLAEAGDMVSHGQEITEEDLEAHSGIVRGNAILARMLSDAISIKDDEAADRQRARRERRKVSRELRTGTQEPTSLYSGKCSVESYAADERVPLETRCQQIKKYISFCRETSATAVNFDDQMRNRLGQAERALATIEGRKVSRVN